MTIKELIEKLEKTEKEQPIQNEKYNGASAVLKLWYEKMKDSRNMKDLIIYDSSIDGFLYGLYGAYFISETEHEELKSEMNGIYDICAKKLFDSKKGESL